MDKFEYNVRADEIKELIKEGDYVKAADIADTIDWRRVKSIMMLCTVSDVYKINRRYVESRDILTYAYERNPKGRLILYYLCELSIKLGDVVGALEYYKRFVVAAPKDASQFILLYKIYEAQDATLEERIKVLEELKHREYKEKWAFELAYLYHLVGQTSLCIDECDEIFLWFGKGKYVTKALELKQLHVPLPEDQALRLNESQVADFSFELDNVDGVDYYAEEEDDEESAEEIFSVFDEIFTVSGMNKEDIPADDIDIQIRPVDVSEYNTMNLQQEIAENMKELLSKDTKEVNFAPPLPSEEMEEIEDESSEEIYFEETGELAGQVDQDEMLLQEELTEVQSDTKIEEISDDVEGSDRTNQEIKAEMKKGITETGVIKAFNKASSYDEILSQGYDGQISIVVPDEKKIERQITGQLKIDDILTEWERQKKEIEQKRKDEVRSKIQEQTATLFNDFDTQTKIGLLEKLEKAMVDASIKAGPSVIKVADIGTEMAVDRSETVAEPDDEVRRLLDTPTEISYEESLPEVDEDMEVSLKEEDSSHEEIESAEVASEDKEDAVVASPKEDEVVETKDESADITEPQTKAEPDTEKLAPKEVREFTPDEKSRFGRIIQHKKTRRQMVTLLDKIKLLEGLHHLIVTGEESLANMKIIKGIVKEVKIKSGDSHSKVVKISGDTLNKKGVSDAFSHLTNGIVIIENASDMSKDSVAGLMSMIHKPENQLMVILEDNRSLIDELVTSNTELETIFGHRIDLNALDNQSLVEYAKNYAFEQEYSIDEFGVLALHTRIAEMQTSDHEVTTSEVEEIIEEAMYYADRKNPKHFFDILAGKRYDEEDMIVLREKDFLH